MHISEGVLSLPVLLSGVGLTLAGTALGLRKMKQAQVPQAAILTAAFFVASLVHVPIGPSSAHLVLNGLLGIIIGWACFPAILIALLLQALFFQYGGITALGVNTFNMAAPALCFYLLCSPFLGKNTWVGSLAAFIAGAGSIFGAGVLTALSLYFSGKAFLPAAQAIIVVHLPLLLVEGLITAMVIGFILKVRPEMLGDKYARQE